MSVVNVVFFIIITRSTIISMCPVHQGTHLTLTFVYKSIRLLYPGAHCIQLAIGLYREAFCLQVYIHTYMHTLDHDQWVNCL